MYSAGFWDLWGFRTMVSYVKLFAKGKKLQKSEGDIKQRGGDVVIDPHGIIQIHHIGTGPGDRPDISSILQLIESSASSAE